MTSSTVNCSQSIEFLKCDAVCLGTLHRSLLLILRNLSLSPQTFFASLTALSKEFQITQKQFFQGYFIALHGFPRKITKKLLLNSLHCQKRLLIPALLASKHTSFFPHLCAFMKILYYLKSDFSLTSTPDQNYCSHTLVYYSFQLKLAFFVNHIFKVSLSSY